MKATHTKTSRVHHYIIGAAVVYAAILLLGPTLLRSAEFLDTRTLPGEIKEDVCERFSAFSCTNSDSDTGGETGDDEGGNDNNDGDTGGGDEAGDTDGNTGDSGSDGGGSGGGSADPDAVNLTVRTQEGIVVTDTLDEPSRFASDVTVTPDNGGDDVEIEAASALALLLELDEASDEFEIADLQYFASFESFLLNCIEVEGEGELCGSWQYAVNGEYPTIGLDQYLLEDGDQLYLFFGAPRTVGAPERVTVDAPFTATAMEYNPTTGDYEAVSGYTIGLLQESPDDPWNPTELEAHVVGSDGTAVFTVSETGEYLLGLSEDFYYPTVPLTVSEERGGGSGAVLETNEERDSFSIPDALEFLASFEEPDGSYGASLYTDWAALALVAGDADTEAVRAYLENTDTDGFTITDHERRALALMALDVSPYDGTDTNHITAIIDSFGGVQIGDPDAVNDDIFGLIVLAAAGFNTEDDIVMAVIEHLLKEQDAAGRWGSDIDLTAAGTQALTPYESVPGVETALMKARAYLIVQQNADGGWGNSFGDTNTSNPFTTSWVLQAIHALGENPEEWAQESNTPLTYLAREQANDGGIDQDATAEERLWATSYAIPAVLGVTWHDLTDTLEGSDGSAATSNAGTDTPNTSAPTPIAPNTQTDRSVTEVYTADAPAVGRDAVANAVGAVTDPIASAMETGEQELEVEDGATEEGATTSEEETATAANQLAATAEADNFFTEETLRIALLVIALLLIGLGIMQWRKA